MSDKFDPSQQVTLGDANYQKKEKEYGISLDQIDNFINLHGGRDCFQGKASSDLIRWIKEDTYADKQSYVAKLRKENPLLVKEANVFISHAWNSIFLEELEIIKQHFEEERGEKEPILWFDIFTVSQHGEGASQRYEDWAEKFMHAIDSCGRVVQVLYPTFHPYLYYRSWCKLEYFYAKSREPDIVFEIAINKLFGHKSDESSYLDFLICRRDNRGSFFQHTACSKLSDDLKINHFAANKFGKEIDSRASYIVFYSNSIVKRYSPKTIELFDKLNAEKVSADFDPIAALQRFPPDSFEYFLILISFVDRKDYSSIISTKTLQNFEHVFKDSEFGRLFYIVSFFGLYYFDKERESDNPSEEFKYCERKCQEVLETEKGEWFAIINSGARHLIFHYIGMNKQDLGKKYYLHYKEMKKDYIGNKHKYIIPDWTDKDVIEINFEGFCERLLFNEFISLQTMFDYLYKLHPIPLTPSQKRLLGILLRGDISEFFAIYLKLFYHTCISLCYDYDLLEKQLHDITVEYQKFFNEQQLDLSKIPFNNVTIVFSLPTIFKSWAEPVNLAYNYYLNQEKEEFLKIISFDFLNDHNSKWETFFSLPASSNKCEHPVLRILKNYYLALLLEDNSNGIDQMTFQRIEKEVYHLFDYFIPFFSDISYESPIITLFRFYIQNHSTSDLFTSDDLLELYLQCIEKVKSFDRPSTINETVFSYWYTLLFHFHIIIDKEAELPPLLKQLLLEFKENAIKDLYQFCYDRIITNIQTSSHNNFHRGRNEKDYDCWITFLFTLDDHVKKTSFNKSTMLGKKIEVISCLQEGDYDSYDKKVVVPLMKRVLPTLEDRKECYQYQLSSIRELMSREDSLIHLPKLLEDRKECYQYQLSSIRELMSREDSLIHLPKLRSFYLSDLIPITEENESILMNEFIVEEEQRYKFSI